MGETPNPYKPGDNCDICWGPGKKWGDYPTPLQVNITFANIPGACAAGNGTYVATQKPGFPCRWEFDEGNWFGHWTAAVSGVGCLLQRHAPPGVCFIAATIACQTHIDVAGMTADIS